MIENFKAKAREFMSILDWLTSKRSDVQKFPGLIGEYNRLVKWGDRIKYSIEKILEYLPNGLSAPILIPVAAVLAAVGAITYFLNDFYQFKRKFDAAEKLYQETGDTESVKVAIGQDKGELPFSPPAQVKSVLWYGAIGLAAWKFWPNIKRALKL